MDEKDKTIEANVPPIVAGEEVKVLPPTEEDLEAKNIALEAEKARLIEEAANYKLAYLKEKKKKDDFGDDDGAQEEKMRQIASETLANSRLAEITREQDAIIKKALKENKELKLAQLNKTTAPVQAIGTHSEGTPVTDTLITPEQLAAFKARGWNDKDIERYKVNYRKNGGR